MWRRLQRPVCAIQVLKPCFIGLVLLAHLPRQLSPGSLKHAGMHPLLQHAYPASLAEGVNAKVSGLSPLLVVQPGTCACTCFVHASVFGCAC